MTTLAVIGNFWVGCNQGSGPTLTQTKGSISIISLLFTYWNLTRTITLTSCLVLPLEVIFSLRSTKHLFESDNRPVLPPENLFVKNGLQTCLLNQSSLVTLTGWAGTFATCFWNVGDFDCLLCYPNVGTSVRLECRITLNSDIILFIFILNQTPLLIEFFII